MFVSLIGSALSPALAAFVRDAVAHGAAPYKNVELNTSVPGLGPYTLDNGGAYTLTVYPGSVMTFAVTPMLGRFLNAAA